jgi:hypothetical protein
MISHFPASLKISLYLFLSRQVKKKMEKWIELVPYGQEEGEQLK